jgi:hypothetical protein
VFLVLLFGASRSLSAALDTLCVSNGNILVGEIKGMERSVLTMKTEYSDSDFKIDWDRVVAIYSSRLFVLTNSKGDRYYGTIRTDESHASGITVVVKGMPYTLKLSDVVYIAQVDEGFLSRLSASIDVGFSFAKTNNLTQFSMRSNFGFLADDYRADAFYSGVHSSQDNVDATRRNEGGLGLKYFLPSDWFVIVSYDFLQNDEQKLKLRSTTQLGAGKFFVRTNALYFTAKGGAAWNSETYTDPAIPGRNTAEGFVGLELNLFDMGDLSVLTNLVVYPGITESGRVRSDFKFDMKYDLPLDIYAKFGYTLNYDNRPVEGASASDYILQTTVGWEF